METRYSERVKEMELKKFNEVVNKVKELCGIFSNPQNYIGIKKIHRVKHIRTIYILILENIKLFHKYFPAEKLNIMFKTLTARGYHLIHCENSKTIQKMIEKPILDLVTYIHNYNETVSRVSYKLSNQMNKDVSLTILSYVK